jgi:hypothetical protein
VNCGACKRNQNGKLELATILIIKMIQILWKKYIFDDYKSGLEKIIPYYNDW